MDGSSNIKSVLELLVLAAGLLTATIDSCAAQVEDYEYPALVEDPVYPYYEDGPHEATIHDEALLAAVAESGIRKCRCGAAQVLVQDGGGCQEADTFDIVIGADWSMQTVRTSKWGNVTVKPLECPFNTKRYTLPREELFGLLLSGELFILNMGLHFDVNNYCYDHILEEAGSLAWEVNVCLPPPTVPRCCPQGQRHVMRMSEGSKYTCKDHEIKTTTFSPLVTVGTEILRWNEVDFVHVSIECDSQKTMRTQVLDHAGTRLGYSNNGTHLLRQEAEYLLPFDSYCLSQTAEDEYEVLMCHRDLLKEHFAKCTNTSCVRKCCPKKQVFSTERGCTNVTSEDGEWRPVFADVEEGEDPPEYTLVEGFPLCRDYYNLEPAKSKHDRYSLLKNGSIYLHAVNLSFPATDYCMDYMTNATSVIPLVLFCFHEPSSAPSSECDVKITIYPIAMSISCLFLFVTLAVYISLPDLRERIHGKCLVSHVSALLVAYVTLIVTQIGIESLSMDLCIANGVIMHFSFLAAFFWLNVMCFDIFWTLKSLNPVPDRTEQVRLRFKLYSLYAWGCPLTLSIVVITMQFLPEEYDNILRPGLGSKSCWFDEPAALWIYFYAFVTVLLTLNLFCFVGVGCILYSLQNTCGSTLGREKELERLWLYVKLFAVMGITWVTEIISYQAGGCHAWIPTDITNALQGFIIFLIFICKRNIIRKLQQRYGSGMLCFKDLVQPSRRTGQTARTPAPQHGPSSYSSDGRGSQSIASQRTTQTVVNPTSIKRPGSNGMLSPAPEGPLTTALPLTTFSSAGPAAPRTTSCNSLPLDSISEVGDNAVQSCPTQATPPKQVQKGRAKPTFSQPESSEHDSPQVVRLKVPYGPVPMNQEGPQVVKVDSHPMGPEPTNQEAPQVVRVDHSLVQPESIDQEGPQVIIVDPSPVEPELTDQDDPQEGRRDSPECEDQRNPEVRNVVIPDVIQESKMALKNKNPEFDVEAGGLSPDDLEGPDFAEDLDQCDQDIEDKTVSDA